MTDFAISVFRFANRRGYFVPRLNVDYIERGTALEWRVSCGGTRGYAVQFGPQIEDDRDERALESHFMMRRVTSSLLLAGGSLFQADPCGRLLFRNVAGDVSWTSYLDWPDPAVTTVGATNENRVYDWCKAIVAHTVLRRAADDAHNALPHPDDALIYVYRGLEWLVVGMGISWDDLAKDIGVPVSELRELKKTANVDTGLAMQLKPE